MDESTLSLLREKLLQGEGQLGIEHEGRRARQKREPRAGQRGQRDQRGIRRADVAREGRQARATQEECLSRRRPWSPRERAAFYLQGTTATG